MKSRVNKKVTVKPNPAHQTKHVPSKEQTMILLADFIIDSFLELRNKKKDDIVNASST